MPGVRSDSLRLLEHAIRAPRGKYPWLEFPAHPIWPAFIANTFFYAGILWLLIPGPFALRRLIRRRRGLCPGCAYDLRHAQHEACPECGLAA